MNQLNRRTFIKAGAATLAGSPILSALAESNALAAVPESNELIWGLLLHLGRNMWGDSPTAYTPPVDHFTCDEKLWDELTEKAAKSGLNMIVVDLGEAIQYQSHPEQYQGAWTVEKLCEDLERRKIDSNHPKAHHHATTSARRICAYGLNKTVLQSLVQISSKRFQKSLISLASTLDTMKKPMIIRVLTSIL